MKLFAFLTLYSICSAAERRQRRATNKDAIDDVLDAIDRLNSWTDLYAVKYAKKVCHKFFTSTFFISLANAALPTHRSKSSLWGITGVKN